MIEQPEISKRISNMKFYSTNNKEHVVNLVEAVFNSLPPDNGLYMPQHISQFDETFLRNLHHYSFQELAYHVARAMLNNDVPDDKLKEITAEAVNFPAPLVALEEDTYVLELFHGPSLAFKDFGARFMSRLMQYFLEQTNKEIQILVATSGDTGGAVALGFLSVPHIRVTILYPKGKVSDIQELQLTTNGHNITAIEVDGTFDDCQRMVKEAFLDNELAEKFNLSSANSINIARLIPQMFYYFNTIADLQRKGIKDVVFSVPSGNYGNIGAGLMAWKMGLPVAHFIAASNANDVVPEFFETGVFKPRPSVQTIANAMDVGDPSNWKRIVNMFGSEVKELKQLITAFAFSDGQTRQAMRTVYEKYDYIMCPHTAIAWLALQQWQENNKGSKATGVLLSTAHPCKFLDVFDEEMRGKVQVPVQVERLKLKNKQAVAIRSSYQELKKLLLA